ncbi:hypothetical protein KVQ82_14820 [Pseudomonas sp. AO-1]|uniref:hypothetical protein n=1 Tax=unclassified Pseudomonas TaxID=196821 RepID=UPI0013792AF9|nr:MULTISPECIES: hypothetical protein [unclassified Pseudomonas]QXZ17117.1 hypothetical protein KVQ82_14820 [Pseudomonas sp. AO-1]
MHSPPKKPAKQSRVVDKTTVAPGAPRHSAQKTGKYDDLRSFFHDLMNEPGSSEHLLIL